MNCRVVIIGSGYNHHEMIQLAEEFCRSMLGSYGDDLHALRVAYEAYKERHARPVDFVPSPEFRFERAWEAAHRDAILHSGVTENFPFDAELIFR